MSTLDDRHLLDDLRTIPGWDELADSPPPVAPAHVLGRSAAVIRAAIAADLSAGVRPITSARRRQRRWVSAAVAGVAAAAVLVAAPTISTPGNEPASVASASQFLIQLAATTPARAGLDADFWKVTFSSVNPSDATAGSEETTTSLWYGRTGGQWVQTAGDRVVRANTLPAQFAVGPNALLSWGDVKDLSSDPDTLEAHLQSLIEPLDAVVPGSIVEAASSLLATAPLSSAQRSALLTILGRQGDVTMRQGVTDAAGRTGTALDFPNDATHTQTLVMADDGTLLEVLWVASADHTIVMSSPTAEGHASPATGQVQVFEKGQLLTRQTYLSVGGTNTAPTK